MTDSTMPGEAESLSRRNRRHRRQDIYRSTYRQRAVVLLVSGGFALMLMLAGAVWLISDLRLQRKESLVALSSWALLQVLEQQPEADASVNNVLRDIRQKPHADKTIRQLLDTNGSMIRTYLYPADMANSWQRNSTFDASDRDLLEAFSDYIHRNDMAVDGRGVADLSTPGRRHWTVAYAFTPDGRSARLVAASANDYFYSPRFRIEIAGAILLFTGLLLAFATRVLLHWQKQQIFAMLALERSHRVTRRTLRGRANFFTHMSHELRTPLNAVIGFSEMMNSEIFGPLLPRYKDYAGDILHSARHLLSVIDNILDLSKIESGRWVVERQTTTPGAIVESARRMTAVQAERCGVTLVIANRAAECWQNPLQADARVMTQALVNLLANAIAFTPPGGRVTVDCDRDIISGDMTLAVTDTGPGMSAAEAREALVPYVSRDSQTARSGRGTGLGLPLARAFARLHGGELRLHSQPGRGTQAILVLPADATSSAAPEDQPLRISA
ncbi:sensor histidine kinase [Ferrovibrio xuzhouensis]|uniref:histidine kinase n=1 Tax=Ferrovibrio xuzhouensis TaxID=1576914 RepID=A0ABV7VD97_9PROT